MEGNFMEGKQPLVILAGPTAVGKTPLSIKLAKRIGGEIISADSMQVYKYMDIGSAKIKKEEMEGIPHHLIDFLLPEEEFNVFVFKKLAKKCIGEICARGHIPIITGGTGFYIQAVLYDIDFSEEEDKSKLRQELENIVKEKGSAFLYERLKETDPASAESIHPNNVKRLIRAVEYYELTGLPISEHNRSQRQKEPAYRCCYFVLNEERKRLYEKIDRRVDEMLSEGLLEETAALKARGCQRGMTSMQGIGYKEILSYLDGELSLEEAVSLIKQDSRHFAKRQLTWFKRERDVIWINKDEFNCREEKMLDFMTQKIRERMDEAK